MILFFFTYTIIYIIRRAILIKDNNNVFTWVHKIQMRRFKYYIISIFVTIAINCL